MNKNSFWKIAMLFCFLGIQNTYAQTSGTCQLIYDYGIPGQYSPVPSYGYICGDQPSNPSYANKFSIAITTELVNGGAGLKNTIKIGIQGASLFVNGNYTNSFTYPTYPSSDNRWNSQKLEYITMGNVCRPDGNLSWVENNGFYTFTFSNSGCNSSGTTITFTPNVVKFYGKYNFSPPGYTTPEQYSSGVIGSNFILAKTMGEIDPSANAPVIAPDIAGLECEDIKIPNVSQTTFSDWWTGVPNVSSFSQKLTDKCTREGFFGTGANGAYDSAYMQCYDTGSTFPQGALVFPGSATANLYASENNPIDTQFLSFRSIRNGNFYNGNVFVWSGATNSPNLPFGRAFAGINGSDDVVDVQVYGSGGKAWLLLADGLTSGRITLQTFSKFSGFAMGNAPLVKKTQCSAPTKNNYCEFDIENTSFICRPSLVGNGFANGDCGIDSYGRCAPKMLSGAIVVGPQLPGQEEIIGKNGETLYSYPKSREFKQKEFENRFSCDEYSGLGWFDCGKKILKNTVKLFTSDIPENANIIASPVEKVASGSATGTGESIIGSKFSTGSNLLEKIVNGGWNRANDWDSEDKFTKDIQIFVMGCILILITSVILLIALILKK